MKLTVSCQCGQRFLAADHLQGRTVPCPFCGDALQIPSGGATGDGASGFAIAGNGLTQRLPAPARATTRREPTAVADDAFPLRLVCAVGGGVVALLVVVILIHSFFPKGDLDPATGTGTAWTGARDAVAFSDTVVEGRPIHDPPFDVDAFLEMPAEDRNAAPLYLEAMAEFDDEVVTVTGLRPRLATPPVSQRRQAINVLYERLQSNPASVSDSEIAFLLSELLFGKK